MTASTFTAHSNTSRGTVDKLIERAATGLLAWSDRRAAKHRLTNERMALIRENQRSTSRGGSALGR